MIESFYEVTLTNVISKTNSIYGRMESKVFIRNSCEMEKDERKFIAPFGVKLIALIEDERIEIKVSRHFLDDNDDYWYFVFSNDDLTYIFELYVDENGVIDKESTNLTIQCTDDYIMALDTFNDKMFAKDFLMIEPFIS